MESIKVFKKRLHLPFLHKYQQASRLTDLCCLSVNAEGVALAYVRHLDNKKQLEWCEFYPLGSHTLASLLPSIVKEHDLEGKVCALMLQRENYQLIPLEELPVSAEEFQSAVRWKIKDLLPFPIKDAVIDSFPVEMSTSLSSKKMIMIIAAQASVLQPLADDIYASGLLLKIIDIPELAYCNVTMLYSQAGTNAFVYLQEKSSDLIITRQKNFCMSRRIEIGLQSLSSIIADETKIGEYVDMLALEIQRSFDYYQAQSRLTAPTNILLAYSNEVAVDIANYLFQRLNVPVHTLDLREVISCRQKLNIFQQGRFLSVIGGALREEITLNATN